MSLSTLRRGKRVKEQVTHFPRVSKFLAPWCEEFYFGLIPAFSWLFLLVLDKRVFSGRWRGRGHGEGHRGIRAYLSAERNLSPHTLRSYLADLRQFRQYIEENGLIPQAAAERDQLAAIDHLVVRSFLSSLYRRKVRKVTIVRKIAALRTFFNYLLREGRVRVNPAEMVQAPKAEKYLPTFLPVEEMFSLLNLKFADDAAGSRDRAMLELFYSSGMRVSELTGLNLGDIDLARAS